jgi:hypothetical protein
VKSGIPLAGALVEMIAWSYCKAHDRSPDNPTLMCSGWRPWLHQQSWKIEENSSSMCFDLEFHQARATVYWRISWRGGLSSQC